MMAEFFTKHVFLFNYITNALIYRRLNLIYIHCSIMANKIFQNDENDAFDENENNDENLFETFEQNEDFVIEAMQ